MKRKAGVATGHDPAARRATALVQPAPVAAGRISLSRGSVLSREYFPSSIELC